MITYNDIPYRLKGEEVQAYGLVASADHFDGPRVRWYTLPPTAELYTFVRAALITDAFRRKQDLPIPDYQNARDEIARIIEIVAQDGLPHPRDLDVALDAIICLLQTHFDGTVDDEIEARELRAAL